MCKPHHQIRVSHTCDNQIFIGTSTREAADWLEQEFGLRNIKSVGVLDYEDYRGSNWYEFVNHHFVLTVNYCFDTQEVRRKIERMDGKLPEKGES